VFSLPEVIRRLRGDRNGRAGEEEGEGKRQTHDNFLWAKKAGEPIAAIIALHAKFFWRHAGRFSKKVAVRRRGRTSQVSSALIWPSNHCKISTLYHVRKTGSIIAMT
jgi:hypothetical protein